jgi:hypothetical protein
MDGPTFHRPYRGDGQNFLYNLLFCDDLSLFRTTDAPPSTGPLAILLSSAPRTEELERIAKDETQESRFRILAFNHLLARHVTVPARQLLGVVIEVPVDGGLDTLAAFVDGRMRYINHSEKVAIFEATPSGMESERQALIRASEEAVARTGPWDKPRRPPPSAGDVRFTFLVSDGLYFGEGPLSEMERDPIGGSVFAAATQLLMDIVNATTK